MTEFVDLLLDNNDIVRIEYRGEDVDGFLESLTNAEKRGDQWSAHSYSETTAEINGINVSRINMSKVVAWL